MPFSQKKVFAPLWKRIIAYLIDLIVLAVVLSPLPSLALPSPALWDFSLLRPFIFVFLISSILTIFYFALLEYSLGQTIGKLFFSLAAMSQEKTLSFGKALLRNLTKFSTVLVLVDALPVFLGRSHQRFFEQISETEVVAWEK
ncbi:MAG: RDD family protein [Nanoarchaeota archaeon]